MKQRLNNKWAAAKRWLYYVAIAFDQLVNAICCGYPDETLSARSWREQRRYAIYWIDRLFRWDKDENGNFNHCESSYWHEMERKDLPAEYREGMKQKGITNLSPIYK